jgi:hypothetical protein
MKMPISGETVRTIGSWVTITVALVSAISYFVFLELRVRQLETQVHTITVAPSIAGAAAGSGNVPNPMAQACADLARKAADQLASGGFTSAGEIQKLLANLGCGKS